MVQTKQETTIIRRIYKPPLDKYNNRYSFEKMEYRNKHKYCFYQLKSVESINVSSHLLQRRLGIKKIRACGQCIIGTLYGENANKMFDSLCKEMEFLRLLKMRKKKCYHC